jgi:tRNA (guanine-N7-)-methyltransferase
MAGGASGTRNGEDRPREKAGADLRFYGRRKGRPLSQNLQTLLAENLPQLRFDPAKSPQRQFANAPRDMFLEIGFGGGEHLAGLAAARREAGFIGAEPFINGVATLLRHIAERGLENVLIWDDDVRLILQGLPDACLAGAYVMFPDPWPKRRHAARRIINPPMLDHLARIIRPQGRLVLASDDPTAKRWLLAEATSHHAFSWTARRPEDWRKRPDDIPETRYMKKAYAEGRVPSWFCFTRNA